MENLTEKQQQFLKDLAVAVTAGQTEINVSNTPRYEWEVKGNSTLVNFFRSEGILRLGRTRNRLNRRNSYLVTDYAVRYLKSHGYIS